VSVAPHGWDDGQARFYARTLAQSDYAARVAPRLGGPWSDVLDVGAGSGALTVPCLAPRARWHAVEPNAAMRGLLAMRRASLARAAVELRIDSRPWQALPDDVHADVVLAANLGATHHEPVTFFDAMRPRARREMVWVVAAQNGPSTFCLAGFLPASLHGADECPAHERTLAALGAARAPASVEFADWTCRHTFTRMDEAREHFTERLRIRPDNPRAAAISDWLDEHALAGPAGVTVACPKRSAVLRWTR
jgi:SAM-dependent methyltransferase